MPKDYEEEAASETFGGRDKPNHSGIEFDVLWQW